ncbi:RHS repeat-associated core domain-containing protein [Chryseobacterium taeanense]|uniref:RHS repeat-associated core domain-containing protein n=1 Tax=Chryseobacterium taeanense TaxID=311334 RepID=A0A1G8GX49_9FLAO|nr:DUF6443 domain-containing protein [Chryseobacterium taeanense]SDH98937.1 RHS repeat-associated core domain-containing protein [Chryseobacterium taeanense]
MKKIIMPIGALLLSGLSNAQNQSSSTENYIYSKTYLDYDAVTGQPTKTSETVQYFDGLGRPKQVVNVKASPQGKDVVNHIEYDGFGRQVKDYLPVPQQGTQNGAIYTSPLSNATQPELYGSEKIFAEKILENSPLDRILQQKQVGTAWDTKPVQFGYDVNIVGEVKKYMATFNYNTFEAKITASGFYGAGQLYKNTVTDEDNNKTVEFKNGQGQVILVKKMLTATESADTYYVYNDYDQLAFVISPNASEAIKNLAVGEELPSDVLNNLCYQYKYDGRNRLVEKKLPGKGREYMVYDKQDRLVLTRDAVLEAQGKWLFTKYDQFSRPIYTGILDSPPGRAQQVVAVEGLGSNNEVRTTSSFNNTGMDVYYTTNSAYPQYNYVLLSVNYYDTYPTYSFNPAFPTTILGETTLTDTPTTEGLSTKSLPVMSLVKNIEDDNWTKNYTYYDKKGRTIGSYSINHLGGRTKVESRLDFAGVVQQSITRHKRLDTDTDKVITENFTYDPQNRLLMHTHQVDSNPVEYLAQNTYNELSQLSGKKVGGISSSSPLQDISYNYNIRGWMTKINDPANLNGKLFGYSIKYEQPQTTNWTPRYNGNISEVDWQTSQDGTQRRYVYMYDALNRLTGGYYQEPNSTVIWTGYYNEYYHYDLNGNITTLNRFSKPSSGTTPEHIDDLVYNYTGNRLDKITLPTGVINNPSGYNALQNTISYDLNGNMTIHPDKGITAITYNYLNLPSVVTNSSGRSSYKVDYLYRADGTKIKKSLNSFVQSKTDYLDGFQYLTSGSDVLCVGCPRPSPELQFVPTSEGYYDFVENKYIYNYVDHLGNVRVSYFNNGSGIEVLEENNYYPFGLKHEGYNALAGNSAYQYEYNGKELQTETGMYDYGARFYMPDIGRWGVVDPKAELLESSSPYVYALNSPILYIDKDGELPILINGRVSEGDIDRASPSYWTQAIINTIKGSGIPNPGGQFHFVDGDRYAQQDFYGNWSIQKGNYFLGNTPENRIQAGRMAMNNAEFQSILSKLAKDPKTGKIIEKIQIYTHSRGAAFGQGYTERLVQMIKENAALFADPDNEVEFSYNMAPHQSGRLKAVDGVDTYTLDHNHDGLSGNDMKGAKGAFSSNERVKGFFGAHDISSFQKDLKAFTSAVLQGGTNQQIINNFVQEMKKKYNITVTVSQ